MTNTQIHHFIIILLCFIAIYALKVIRVYGIRTIEMLLQWYLAEHLFPTPHSMSPSLKSAMVGAFTSQNRANAANQVLFLLMPQRDCYCPFTSIVWLAYNPECGPKSESMDLRFSTTLDSYKKDIFTEKGHLTSEKSTSHRLSEPRCGRWKSQYTFPLGSSSSQQGATRTSGFSWGAFTQTPSSLWK